MDEVAMKRASRSPWMFAGLAALFLASSLTTACNEHVFQVVVPLKTRVVRNPSTVTTATAARTASETATQCGSPRSLRSRIFERLIAIRVASKMGITIGRPRCNTTKNTPNAAKRIMAHSVASHVR